MGKYFNLYLINVRYYKKYYADYLSVYCMFRQDLQDFFCLSSLRLRFQPVELTGQRVEPTPQIEFPSFLEGRKPKDKSNQSCQSCLY